MSSSADMEMFMVALGAEIRWARKGRGWTRRELALRLPDDISIQTIGTWEAGTRGMRVLRLIQVGEALGTPVEELLGRARARVSGFCTVGDPGLPALALDVTAVATSRLDIPAPVRAWAKCRCRENPDGASVVQLDVAALDRLAVLCESSTRELTDRLISAGLASLSGACDSPVSQEV